MLSQEQNTVVYLMFLNGILFMGLNRIAYSITNPGPKGSKGTGYALILAAFLALCAQQEYRALAFLEIAPQSVAKILLGGFIAPVFLTSLAYHRARKKRDAKPGKTAGAADSKHDDAH